MQQRAPLYQVDSFTSRLFSGNPAAVCLLEEWPADEAMLRIAAENNLSETAFYNPNGGELTLRWFTPAAEVDLCGHATLATAYVLFRRGDGGVPALTFRTRSGELPVRRNGDRLTMNFPSRPPHPADAPPALLRGLAVQPRAVLRARDYLVLLEDEHELLAVSPDFEALASLDALGVIITAPGSDCDFVSRFFAPRVGVPEDPVTGSAHCTLTPYWAERLGRTALHARQLSSRGGELWCEQLGDRVEISGEARCFFEGACSLA